MNESQRKIWCWALYALCGVLILLLCLTAKTIPYPAAARYFLFFVAIAACRAAGRLKANAPCNLHLALGSAVYAAVFTLLLRLWQN